MGYNRKMGYISAGNTSGVYTVTEKTLVTNLKVTNTQTGATAAVAVRVINSTDSLTGTLVYNDFGDIVSGGGLYIEGYVMLSGDLVQIQNITGSVSYHISSLEGIN